MNWQELAEAMIKAYCNRQDVPVGLSSLANRMAYDLERGTLQPTHFKEYLEQHPDYNLLIREYVVVMPDA